MGVFCFLFSLSFVFAGVQSLSEAAIRKHPKGAELRVLAQGDSHGNKSAFVGHLTVPANGRVPLHRDKTEEYLFVLSGVGTLWIDGQKHQVKKNDLIFMPAGAEVKFENGKRVFKVLQFFAPSGPESKYDSWALKE